MMVESTLHRMFDLDQCIDVTFEPLDKIIQTVDVKFTQFCNISSTVTDPKEVSYVIREGDDNDDNDDMVVVVSMRGDGGAAGGRVVTVRNDDEDFVHSPSSYTDSILSPTHASNINRTSDLERNVSNPERNSPSTLLNVTQCRERRYSTRTTEQQRFQEMNEEDSNEDDDFHLKQLQIIATELLIDVPRKLIEKLRQGIQPEKHPDFWKR
ncbi:hypothetical protein EAG_09825 [Camponotus floridanus]|uniref:Uncharacterized protein n=1 Tax=Camponotus floridanus TaxID=104421 RepID=E2AYA7_CAMFO|nr:hypothetical protein EAG_09825 [Camponotus floridanus]